MTTDLERRQVAPENEPCAECGHARFAHEIQFFDGPCEYCEKLRNRALPRCLAFVSWGRRGSDAPEEPRSA